MPLLPRFPRQAALAFGGLLLSACLAHTPPPAPPDHPLQTLSPGTETLVPVPAPGPTPVAGMNLPAENSKAEEEPAEALPPPPPKRIPPPVSGYAAPPAAEFDAARQSAPASQALAKSAAGTMSASRPAPLIAYAAPIDTERYAHREANPVRRAAEEPVSTFSADVDTASYANLRRILQQGNLPPADAVRVEEMINYFDYGYAAPAGTRPDVPFEVHTELAPTPWNAHSVLLRIGLQGWMPQGELPTSNLVFLVDVSGSMDEPDKLPLLKSALKLLSRSLRPQDRLSLVVYAGNTGLVLAPTSGAEQARIESAIDHLSAGGSTNGGAGIRLAYAMARQAFVPGGINRILLCTDGDFNVGTTDFRALKTLVERERATGVSISTLGFGAGNYNDQLMQELADAGNGNYSYIDSLLEAQKVLVTQRAGTLSTIAKDVKIQVEFNPAQVSGYRLIGYEKRALQREDFNNDRVDAGDVGAGHTVTALYEVTLAGSGGERIDALRYAPVAPTPATGDEIAYLRLRYKAPDGDVSRLIEHPIRRGDMDVGPASEGMRWAAAVAAFGQQLTGGKYLQGFGYDRILRLAEDAHHFDPQGNRGEMLRLIGLAESLTPKAAALNAREPTDRPEPAD